MFDMYIAEILTEIYIGHPYLITLQIFNALQVNYRKMMVDVTRKTYYSLVAHQRIVGFSCYSYMKLQVCTVICYCHYHQTIRVQSGQCRMPLLLQAKYLQCKKYWDSKPNIRFRSSKPHLKLKCFCS